MSPPAAEAMVVLVVAPLAAAACAFAWPARGRALALGTAVLLASAAALLAFAVAQEGGVVHAVGGWGAPLGIDLRADGLGALLSLLVALVALPATVHAVADAAGRPDDAAGRLLWPLWLLLLGGLNALFLSADVFNLYVTLELTGLSAVALVALAGGAAALEAALRYLFVGLGGSLLFLMGVALVYGAHGSVALPILAERVTGGPVDAAALALMTGGLLLKGALFPLHFWLPSAHANAPAPVSAVLSALVVKGAFCILLRLWFESFGALATPEAGVLLGLLGGGAILWGSLQALAQARLKLLIAYSTVAQLGYLFLLFPLAFPRAQGWPDAALWSGAVVYLMAHALAKAAMFLAAGNLLRVAGHDRFAELEGFARVLPVSAFAFGLAGISIVGLPPSGGFVGKWQLLLASFEHGPWWGVAVIAAGTLLAAAYVTRVMLCAFAPGMEAPGPGGPAAPLGDRGDRGASAAMEWSAFALGLAAVALGLLAEAPAELLGPPPGAGAGR